MCRISGEGRDSRGRIKGNNQKIIKGEKKKHNEKSNNPSENKNELKRKEKILEDVSVLMLFFFGGGSVVLLSTKAERKPFLLVKRDYKKT